MPNFRSKRRAVDITYQIESDISGYLITITIMNTIVGLATALVVALTGVGDPLLWGTIAFLLNYAPIIGPAAGLLIFLFAGLLSISFFGLAFLRGGFIWRSN